MSQEATALAIPNVPAAVSVMKEFERLKHDLLGDEDTVVISGKRHIKRSGWRKISLCFNVSTSITSVEHEETEDSRYIVRVRARATAPNGRFSEEIAVCDSTEFERGRLEGSLHNIESKAATRAINRAISDLVGGGEISAEELVPGQEPAQQQQEQEAVVNGLTKFTWTVKGAEAPMEPQSGPYGFLRSKVLQGLIDKHSITLAEEKVGGRVIAIALSGLPLDSIKDVAGAIGWAVSKLNNCSKADVKILVDGKEWAG